MSPAIPESDCLSISGSALGQHRRSRRQHLANSEQLVQLHVYTSRCYIETEGMCPHQP